MSSENPSWNRSWSLWYKVYEISIESAIKFDKSGFSFFMLHISVLDFLWTSKIISNTCLTDLN